jgi:FkbM family methyltransferase
MDKSLIKKIIKKCLNKFGIKISKVGTENSLANEFSMEGALYRCKTRGLQINTVIDIGASDGRWSRMCLNYLPKSKYLLFEPQEPHKAGLEKLKEDCDNIEYITAAAGNREGKIYFENGNLLGGLVSETFFEGNCIEVPVTTIDIEVSKRGLKPPYLIKLDTHGFEIPIMEGAKQTIKQAGLIIIETYNFKLTKDSLKYYQMCSYMENLGFSSVEMVDLMLRRLDSSFWQMDTFFIPSGRNEFKNNSYQ